MESQKLYMNFQLCEGTAPLISTLFKGVLYYSVIIFKTHNVLWGRYNHPHFKDDKTETENYLMMFPRLPKPENAKVQTQVYWVPNPMFHTERNVWNFVCHRFSFESWLYPKVNQHYFLFYFTLFYYYLWRYLISHTRL